MKTAKINHLEQNIACRVTLAAGAVVPPCQQSGNPTAGETLSVSWRDLYFMGLDLHFDLPKPYFIDSLEVRFSDKVNLLSLSLLDAGNGQVLSRFTAETDTVSKKGVVKLDANTVTDRLIVRCYTDISDIEITGVDLYGAYPEPRNIFPTPDRIVWGTEEFDAQTLHGMSTDSDLAKDAMAVLSEKWYDNLGVTLSTTPNASIFFCLDRDVPFNGYTLDILLDRVTISASDCRGFVMGAETLIKTIEKGRLITCKITDRPRLAFRGMHLFLPSVANFEFAKRYIKHYVSPMGYNAVIIEVCGMMRFDSHPEINEKLLEALEKSKEGEWPKFPHAEVAEGTVLEKETVRAFADYIRSFGIDVIPEIQSLSHVSFMTHAHPEIAELPYEAATSGNEIDTRAEDVVPNLFYPHCYCPSNPKSYEILFDLIDEIIEVFHPKTYVHMGHDEVYDIGVCEICRNRDPGELFAEDVLKIYHYLAQKGLKMMIWSDMLQPKTRTRQKLSAYKAIDLLPKDILMLDFVWYFHLDEDIEDNLLSKGYPVIFGNLYSSHFPRYNSRIEKKGILGAQTSAWVSLNPLALAEEGKLFDFLLDAQMFWSSDYLPQYTHCYEAMIRKIMPKLRERLEAFSFPSLKEGACIREIFNNHTTFPPLQNAERKTAFEVHEPCASLLLYHALGRNIVRHPWTPSVEVGAYVFTFEDGTTDRLELKAGCNIGYWNTPQYQSIKHKLYRHSGYTNVYFCNAAESKTPDGETVCLYQTEYIVPKGKILRSVCLEENHLQDPQILFCKAEIVNDAVLEDSEDGKEESGEEVDVPAARKSSPSAELLNLR